MDPITTPAVHVPPLVTFDAVGDALVAKRKHPPVRQPRAALDDVVLVHGARQPRVLAEPMSVPRPVVGLHGARVRDVEAGVVRAEAEAVALGEAVGDGAGLARGGVVGVDLRGEVGRRAEGLLVAVGGVCEPDSTGGVVHDDVVDGVELAAVEVVEEGCAGRGCGVHED